MTDLHARSGVGATFALTGEIDVLTAGAIEDAARAALDDGAPLLDIDLAEVTFMDSQGLNALMQAHRAMAAAGATLRVVNVPRRVQRTFVMTGLDRVLGATVDA
jgi:anti-anti-sigma factor